MSEERTSTGGADLRRWLVLVRLRARQGSRRVRTGLLPIVTAAVAAALAWTVAHVGLGHEFPFFAPVAAWVCLGFSADRQVRRVAELAVGVSLGVGLGEVIALLIGTGAIQVFLVIVIAATVARFVDRGQLLTVQAGVQGIVIVALPVAATGGAANRWVDALIGGAFALVVALATPRDARRRTRSLAQASMAELAGMLRALAQGVRTGDRELVRDALARGRGTQDILDDWSEAARNARQAARFSPGARVFLPELNRLHRASLLADRAMRNARVVARRGLIAVEEGGFDQAIADDLDRVARGAQMLGAALGSDGDTGPARAELAAVAGVLAPEDFRAGGWRLQTIVILLRSLTVDLLQATGLSSSEATAELAADPAGPQSADGEGEGEGAAGGGAVSR